jgi:hypothetical protein
VGSIIRHHLQRATGKSCRRRGFDALGLEEETLERFLWKDAADVFDLELGPT